MEKILVSGASGFVGRYLVETFLETGHDVTGLGTSPTHPFTHRYDNFSWICADTREPGEWQEAVSKADWVINLAGRSIFQYWTRAHKENIRDSRVLTTKNIVDAIGEGAVLLSASAVGYYGEGRDEELTEDGACGKDFLSTVCLEWENEALMAQDKGVRLCIMRFGVVLGQGGALAIMAPMFKSFMGGPLGNGLQWFPWIHLLDLERGAHFLLENEGAAGVYNFTAPQLVRQREFSREMGRALKRPAFLPAPGFMVKTVMGELGASLLTGQKAPPKRLLDTGFEFRYPTLRSALNQVYNS